MNNKCSINNNGCLGNNIDDCDKLSCVYNSNKLLDLICTTKLIYESIHNDISEIFIIFHHYKNIMDKVI